MNRGIRALVASLVIILTATGFFIGGVLFAGSVGGVSPVGSLTASPTADTGVLVDRVLGIIQERALEPSSDESVTANAIRGALNRWEIPMRPTTMRSSSRISSRTRRVSSSASVSRSVSTRTGSRPPRRCSTVHPRSARV